ncbi:MAG: hypothetical protein KDD47_17230, partial [Acidobacteria bacterium]|nr:hypothetical protein [Acidobacteriota bacterium]
MDPELFSRLPVSPEVLSVLIGVVLLVAGRRIFWLTLGAAAFTAGALLSTYLPVEMKAEGRLLLALISGLLGILLASFIRRTGVAVGGLVIGALLGLYAAQAYDPGAGAAALLGAAIGALLG